MKENSRCPHVNSDETFKDHIIFINFDPIMEKFSLKDKGMVQENRGENFKNLEGRRLLDGKRTIDRIKKVAVAVQEKYKEG
ncbi:hypothetical protein RUM43_005112 [Polyplax serrata]|uniref:Uncharacterized protein n=1 Tax=Polyplax serrata TaxID=468196 RepID=A0AAN8XR57_POLSC